jgi:hypothetical protein
MHYQLELYTSVYSICDFFEAQLYDFPIQQWFFCSAESILQEQQVFRNQLTFILAVIHYAEIFKAKN